MKALSAHLIASALVHSQMEVFFRPMVAPEDGEWTHLGTTIPTACAGTTYQDVPVSVSCKRTAFTLTAEARAAAEETARRIADPQDLEDGLLAVHADNLIERLRVATLERAAARLFGLGSDF